MTTFSDRTESVTFERPNITFDSFWSESHKEESIDLQGVMTRPIEVANFTWTQRDGQFTQLHNSLYPDTLLANRNLRGKAEFFTFMRANVRVKVLVNSTPFMIGKLWLYFSPYQTYSGTVPTSLAEVTGYPGVELDVGTAQSMELVIPYCSPLSAINLVTGEGEVGEFTIVVLNPLVSTTTVDAVSVSVFANFENVELSLPTAMPMFQYTATRDTAFPQADEGEQMSKDGVISGVADSVGAVASAASELPVIGPVAKTVSWVADAIGGAARFFGFNKPVSEIAQQPISNVPAKGWTNMDGLDSSIMLGASPVNETVTKHVFSTDVDEMDVAYVARKSAYLTTYFWSQTNEPGVVLAAIPVHPGASYTTKTGSLTCYHPTMVGFVSSMFEYWRGPMVYRISFAKNAFYSGRLRVSYVPQATSKDTTGMDLNQARNWIIDLAGNQHEITVPFVYNAIWAKTRLHDLGAADPHCMTGMLYISVLNELRAPDAVPTTIQFNVWVCGGENIEFAMPSCAQYQVSSAKAQIDDEDDGGAAHDEQMRPGQNPILVASSNSSVEAGAMTTGERITNLRALTKRFSMEGSYVMDRNLYIFDKDPSNFGGATIVDYVSLIYRFYKGSRRWKVWYHHPQAYVGDYTTEPLMAAWLVAEATNANVNQSVDDSFDFGLQAGHNNQFFHMQNPLLNQVMEVTVPFYSNTPIGLVTTSKVQATRFRPRLKIAIRGKDPGPQSGQRFTLLSAAGDDFSFGYLVGAPGVYRTVDVRTPPERMRDRLTSADSRYAQYEDDPPGGLFEDSGVGPEINAPLRNPPRMAHPIV